MTWRTSDIEKVKAGEPYTWGKVVKVHEVGEYNIVEYKDLDNGATKFHGYIKRDGETQDTNQAFQTLDEALINCITVKYQGWNSQAGYYFFRSIQKG
jgi:hypothetical protein